MGTKLIKTYLEEEEIKIPQVPPGFESCLPFHIKTDDDDKRLISCSARESVLGSQLNQKEADGITDSGIISSQGPKFRIKYNQSDNSLEEVKSDRVKSDQMGTKLIQTCLDDGDVEIAAIPPGFESCLPFCFKREDDNNKMISCLATTSALESQSNQKNAEGISDTGMIRSRRRKFRIKYSQPDNSSEEVKSDLGKSGQNLSSWPLLPKGNFRGCSECSNCQKVKARWRPEDARRPELDAAPVFYPSEEDFKDTLRYIASIRTTAEKYGICRIVPPSSWKPPCLLKEKLSWEGCKFATRVQRIDKLQNRHSRKVPNMHIHSRKKIKRRRMWMVGNGTSPGGSIGAPVDAEHFGFEPGPEFTLNTFKSYANDFKSQYFIRDKDDDLQEESGPSVENIEGEYWRMVEKPTEEIEVLYGADLETGIFGSGFPKMSTQASSSDDKYVNSGWNLNNFPRLPGSVLSYESGDISGVLVPWLYIGMCFSSFCWHVEDHHLYSLNYMHWGAPKLWYGIPGVDALKLEEAMRKHLPDLFEEQPDLLHKLVTQLSPSIVKSEGVPVYRCVQKAGEFVLTFPRAYHSGFNCGFNCAEAVNVGPIDWLPHGHKAIELYREQRRRTSISHDKLLLGASRDAVRAHWELHLLKKNTPHNFIWKDVCGNNGILAKALKVRVEAEHVRRNSVCQFSKVAKMESSFDANNERECCVCYFDLHLSAAGCHCSPDRFVCLSHVKQLCSCTQNSKFYLFRYNLDELNLLVEALEGKLSAIYRWAKLDLGLALHSYVSKDTSQTSSQSSHSPMIPASIQNPSIEKPPKFLITFSLGRTKQASFAKHSEEFSDNSKESVLTTYCKNSDFHKMDDDFVTIKESEYNVENSGNGAQHSRINKRGEESGMNGLKSAKNAEQGTGSPSCSQTNLDKYFHQRGPRVAKVARKVNMDVTTLEFGIVQPGKLWCNSFSIFPCGFRSRVRYISVLDPSTTCNYISEILDSGRDEPLFMVSMEDLRREAFIHFSASRCWEMVRDRLNEEIRKQKKMGRKRMPPLQPLGSVDGLDMFGLSSPSVMQSIERMDKDRACSEYWMWKKKK